MRGTGIFMMQRGIMDRKGHLIMWKLVVKANQDSLFSSWIFHCTFSQKSDPESQMGRSICFITDGKQLAYNVFEYNLKTHTVFHTHYISMKHWRGKNVSIGKRKRNCENFNGFSMVNGESDLWQHERFWNQFFRKSISLPLLSYGLVHFARWQSQSVPFIRRIICKRIAKSVRSVIRG